jgi:hypothetical protein
MRRQLSIQVQIEQCRSDQTPRQVAHGTEQYELNTIR